MKDRERLVIPLIILFIVIGGIIGSQYFSVVPFDTGVVVEEYCGFKIYQVNPLLTTPTNKPHPYAGMYYVDIPLYPHPSVWIIKDDVIGVKNSLYLLRGETLQTGRGRYVMWSCEAPDTTTSGVIISIPVSEQPSMSISDIISDIWGWIRGVLGLGLVGAETASVGGQQMYGISITSPESPDLVYMDKTYSELYGTWFIVDSGRSIVAEKGGWSKLSSVVYTDTALVTFSTAGSYSVVSVVVKVPYAYTTFWVKGVETIIAKEQKKVVVSVPQPSGERPLTSISDIISDIWGWIRDLLGGK